MAGIARIHGVHCALQCYLDKLSIKGSFNWLLTTGHWQLTYECHISRRR